MIVAALAVPANPKLIVRMNPMVIFFNICRTSLFRPIFIKQASYM
jgi:hypothetical protein